LPRSTPTRASWNIFPAPLNRAESDRLAARWRGMFADRGLGMWAVGEKSGAAFVGFVGLSIPAFSAAFTPCVETGWRLGRDWWGRGYATEAATAALRFGFGTLGLGEIVAYTARGNSRSRAVMERLGMTYDPADDFVHPQLPDDEPLRFHVLYRLGRDAFDAASR
jgi:RimJ/RimL family protein N-acetyltransferase